MDKRTRKGFDNPLYTRVRKNCNACDKVIIVKKAYVRENNYCSGPCATKGRVLKWRTAPSLHPNWKGGNVTRKCLQCSKSFSVLHAKKDTAKYCSRECKKTALAIKYFSSACQYCGERFQKRERDIKSGVASKTFCSAACRSKFYGHKSIQCKQCNRSFVCQKSDRRIFCSYSCNSIYNVSHQKSRSTDIEKIMTNYLVENNIPFHFQYVLLDKYVVDFYIPQHNLVVQVDGTYWHSLPRAIERDKRCNKELREAGYIVLRLKEKDLVTKDSEFIDGELYNALNLTSTHT